MGRLYVYGLARAGEARGLEASAIADPDAAVEAVDVAGGVAALVSAIDVDEVMSTRRNMITHTRALEEAMAAFTVLPMRFGVIADSAERLAATVAPAATDVLERLGALEGRVEIGLRVSWVRDEIMRAIVRDNPELAREHAAIARRGEAETYYQRIELGRRVDAALAAARDAERQRILARLADAFEDCVVRDPEDDIEVLRAELLLPAEAEPELLSRMEALEAEAEGAFVVKYVGPAPVFNFVDLRLDWSGAPSAATA